jgi:hypothetical protein
MWNRHKKAQKHKRDDSISVFFGALRFKQKDEVRSSSHLVLSSTQTPAKAGAINS